MNQAQFKERGIRALRTPRPVSSAAHALRSQGLVEEMRRIVFPSLTPQSGRYANKIADIDHLVGHTLSGRDVFVTDDRDILRRDAQLGGAIGILVMSPAECLKFADDHYARYEAKLFTAAKDNPSYCDRRLKGIVSFDYSNNDHRFSIGEGFYLFETLWSKASNVCIHGQVVVWRNVNGLYAATKIVAIRDDKRAAEHDELTFEFLILPNGSTDFSK